MALTKSHKKNTGQFDCFMQLQKYVSDNGGGSDDGLGGGGTGTTGEWVDEADIWAKIRTIKGYERLSLDAQNANVSSVICLRYGGFDINDESRLLYKGRAYNIKYVLVENEQACYYEVAASYEVLQ